MTPGDVKSYRLIAADKVALSLIGKMIVHLLCDEIDRLQAENTRLQEIIKLQAATQLELPAGVEIVAQDALLPGLDL